MTRKTMITGAALALCLAMPAYAQEMDHSAHQGMQEGQMRMGEPKGDQGPSSKAFAQANAKMHKDMDIAFTGNADVDFVRGMIAHHQGAIAMARVELEHGKDENLRRLAEGIISAQEAEIETMKTWLAENGK